GHVGGQVTEAGSDQVPARPLAPARFAGGQVRSRPVTGRLAAGLGDQLLELEMGVAGAGRVSVHRFWVHRVWPFRSRMPVRAPRAAVSRLFTVPTGMSSTLATSGRLSPAPKARPSTSRWAGASSWMDTRTAASSAR